MNKNDRRRYDMLVRVRAFCGEHRDIFEATPHGAKTVAALDSGVTALTRHFAAQSSGRRTARDATNWRAEARASLKRSLDAIERTARSLAPEVHGDGAAFHAPGNVGDRQLVADARSVAGHAAPLADAFVAHGLQPNVLTDLPAQIQALEDAIARQTAGREAHVGAGTAIRPALAAGADAVDALDAIFRNGPRQDQDVVGAWKNARRIGPRVKEAASEAPPATSTTKAA